MRPLAQTEARDIVLGQRLRKKLMLLLGFWAGLACAIAIWLAPTAIAIIYGDQFAHVVPVFRLLCLWLWLYVMRRAGLLFTWSLRGQLRAVSRFQWLEAMVITAAAAIGASCHGAVGLATALIAGEILLATVLCTAWHRQHAALVR
jgi:O-antigen/teichoic acid export membrane protein